LVFLKQYSIEKLEDIRRLHIGAFIEHEQDRGLKITSVRQKLQHVYAFMRYFSFLGYFSRSVLRKDSRDYHSTQ
jgi:site-specific recombinase XerD